MILAVLSVTFFLYVAVLIWVNSKKLTRLS